MQSSTQFEPLVLVSILPAFLSVFARLRKDYCPYLNWHTNNAASTRAVTANRVGLLRSVSCSTSNVKKLHECTTDVQIYVTAGFRITRSGGAVAEHGQQVLILSMPPLGDCAKAVHVPPENGRPRSTLFPDANTICGPVPWSLHSKR